MSYLDQITVGSTTYDIKDSDAQRKIIEGSGAPTTSTAAEVGTHYLNTSASAAPYEYLCIDDTGGSYTWVEVGGDPSKELPSGGTTGQVLKKASGTNYDATWGDVDALPSVTSSDNGKYLGVSSGDWSVVDGTSDIYYGTSTPPTGKKVWIDPSGTNDLHGIPSGGSQGQVLTKSSATDYDTTWTTPSGSGSDKMMVVTVTYASSTYSSDKTIDEILAAIADGYFVYVMENRALYELYWYDTTKALFYNIYSDHDNVSRAVLTISKNNNSTRVERAYYNFHKPDVSPQLYWEIRKNGNTYSVYVAGSSGELSYLDLYENIVVGSAYCFVAEEGSPLPHTIRNANTAEAYQFVKFWRTETYDEDYQEWNTVSNALFSKIEIDNGVVKVKQFTLSENDEAAEYFTPIYSEATLATTP